MSRARWVVGLPLLIIGGCLLPSYDVDPAGTVDAAGSSGKGGDAGATGATAGTAAAPDAGSGTGGANTNAGSGSMLDGGEPPVVVGGCTGSQKDCAGVCVDIDDPEYGCTATSCNQSECPAGGATYGCSDGMCVIASCGTDSKLCDGRCVSLSDPTYGCETDSCDDSTCPDPGTGTLICSGNSCVVGTCTGDTKKCGNKCVPFDAANGCADPSSCAACDANEICSGAPSACTCVPDDAEACMGKACGESENNCGTTIDCPDTCTSPTVCGGGSADANSCGYDVPTGSSAGCGKAPVGDSAGYTLRNITVTGVSASFISANPPAAGQGPYTWTARNYYVRLPANYDNTRPYPVVMQAGGCGNTSGNAGQSGGLALLPAGQDDAIQVGLSYTYAEGAGACFADNTAQTPEVPYFDAVLAHLKDNYCVDVGNVFAGGYSTGGYEALLFGCARAGVLRGVGAAAAGRRTARPACSGIPVAAMIVHGENDSATPISEAMLVRDDILMRNGCSGSASTAWDASYPDCVRYTDCPAAYPVVWCMLAGQGHTNGGTYTSAGMWKLFSSLPPGG